jgi:hypothetical protein
LRWSAVARARRLASVPEDAPREQAPDLRDVVKASIASMDWLTETDKAAAALALRQADEIERAVDRAALLDEVKAGFAGDESMFKRLQRLEAMCDVTKTVGWLGPQLQNILRDLGGTPAARAALKRDKPVGSRLAQLRDAAGQHDT